MANPYMRDALLEQMNPDVQAEPQNKLGWNRPGTRNPATAPMTDPAPTSSAYTSTPTSPTTPTNPGYATTSPGYEVSTVQPSSSTSPSGIGVNGLEPQTAPTNPTSPDNPNAGATGTGDPGASATTTAPTTYANAGQNRYAGFDTQRAQDPTTSAKDAFYAATQKAPPMPKDKAGSEVWFNQYIKSALESAGYKVDWVKGDKAFVRTRENPQGEEIDFNQGADSDASSVAWQSNMAGQTTAGTGTGAPGSAGANTAQLNGALTDPAVLANINAQITALMKQGMTMEQIMTLLNTPPQSTGA